MVQRYAVWILIAALLAGLLSLRGPAGDRAKGAVREVLAPLDVLRVRAVAGAGRFVSTLRGLRELSDETRRQQAEIVRLQSQLGQMRELAGENNRLRAGLDFVQRSERRLIPAEVISRDISGWWQTIHLNRGAGDGVTTNCAVVVAEGLVGKTIRVSAHTCEVLLVSDPGCRVSAVIQLNRTFGIVRGEGVDPDGKPLCRMDYIARDADLKLGGEVVTSGLGGVFPAGYLIGYIESIEQDESGLYRHARLLLRADLSRLDYVFIVAAGEADAAGAGEGPPP